MKKLKELFDNNKKWSEDIRKSDPAFFEKLSNQQSPQFLWIGCSDSRVPATQITGLMPGEVFVHRNMANLVVHTDFNLLSVLQYAVDALKVSHVIVCGHYDCGGVKAIIEDKPLGLVDNWLRHLQDVREKHKNKLQRLKGKELVNRICEFNVIEQVMNVCRTTIVQNAWQRGQNLAVHGWIYDIHDGHLRDLNACVASCKEMDEVYLSAISGRVAINL